MARMVLIEDVEANRVLVAKILRHAGHEVLMAPDGLSGLDLVRRERPDAVLLDLSIPAIHGSDALRLLRQDAITRHIPVIALTAHAMRGDREAALLEGFDHYIAKPIDIRTFVSEIEAVMDRSRG